MTALPEYPSLEKTGEQVSFPASKNAEETVLFSISENAEKQVLSSASENEEKTISSSTGHVNQTLRKLLKAGKSSDPTSKNTEHTDGEKQQEQEVFLLKRVYFTGRGD